MSQQVPPNNSGALQGGVFQEGDMVLADGYADASPGSVPRGTGSSQFVNGSSHAGYNPQNFARNRAPMIDPIESARLTPQLLVLLVLAGLKRNWKWSVPLGLFLGLLAGGGLYLGLPTQYEAAAQIQVRAFRPFLIEEQRQQGNYEDFVNTQIALLRSPLVLERALEVPDVAKLPIILSQRDKKGWLTKKLSVSPVRRSEIVNISIATDSVDASEKIVNAVVSTYFNFTSEHARETTSDLVGGLRVEERRQNVAAQTLQDSIRRKTREAVLAGVAAGDGGMSVGMVQGESLARDVALAEARLTQMRAQHKGIIERINNPKGIPTSMMIQMNPELRDLNERRGNLVLQRERLAQALSRSDDPKILTVDRQIEQIDEKVRSLSSGVDAKAMEGMQEFFRFNEEMNLFQLEQEIRIQEILVEELRIKHSDQLVKNVDRSDAVIDAAFQQDQLVRANATLLRLEDRILAVSTEQRAPGQITQLSAAMPVAPSWFRQIAIIGGGAVVLAIFPLLLSIGIERVKPRMYHVSQVRRAIPLVLIGEIMEPPVSWVHGATFRKRLARYRESVHNWCTHLLLSDPFRTCKTLSVASVAGDDGKTFLAIQIAVAMAQMKAGKVLLIDGDMRVGRLHLLFGNEEAGVGLADVLSFRNLPGEAIVQNEKEPNLELLSAGQLDTSPYELLGDGRFRELLDALEESPTNPRGYSLIIVVLPPVANAAESLIMAGSTDSTLLCVRQGETVLAAMEDIYRKLVNTGAAVDGIVVKDIPYYQMAGRDGGFADRLEQIRLSHLLQYAE